MALSLIRRVHTGTVCCAVGSRGGGGAQEMGSASARPAQPYLHCITCSYCSIQDAIDLNWRTCNGRWEPRARIGLRRHRYNGMEKCKVLRVKIG